jgi:hypothetical protein
MTFRPRASGFQSIRHPVARPHPTGNNELRAILGLHHDDCAKLLNEIALIHVPGPTNSGFSNPTDGSLH